MCADVCRWKKALIREQLTSAVVSYNVANRTWKREVLGVTVRGWAAQVALRMSPTIPTVHHRIVIVTTLHLK